MSDKQKILVCTKGKTCRKRGGKELACALKDEIELLGLDNQIKLKKTDCLGHCGKGPMIKLKPQKVWYGGVTPADCKEIIASILRKTPLERLRLRKS